MLVEENITGNDRSPCFFGSRKYSSSWDPSHCTLFCVLFEFRIAAGSSGGPFACAKQGNKISLQKVSVGLTIMLQFDI